MLATKPQLGGAEQPVDDVVVLPHTIIDELAVAFRSDHEQRRRFALRNAPRHFDIDLGSVVKGGERPPRRIVAGDGVAEAQFGDIDAGSQIISWMSFIASTLHPARQYGGEYAQKAWGIAEQKLGAKTWVAGAYSIADIHLFRLFWRFRGSLGADPAKFPGLSAHHDQVMERPAVRKTFAVETALGYALPA